MPAFAGFVKRGVAPGIPCRVEANARKGRERRAFSMFGWEFLPTRKQAWGWRATVCWPGRKKGTEILFVLLQTPESLSGVGNVNAVSSASGHEGGATGPGTSGSMRKCRNCGREKLHTEHVDSLLLPTTRWESMTSGGGASGTPPPVKRTRTFFFLTVKPSRPQHRRLPRSMSEVYQHTLARRWPLPEGVSTSSTSTTDDHPRHPVRKLTESCCGAYPRAGSTTGARQYELTWRALERGLEAADRVVAVSHTAFIHGVHGIPGTRSRGRAQRRFPAARWIASMRFRKSLRAHEASYSGASFQKGQFISGGRRWCSTASDAWFAGRG